MVIWPCGCYADRRWLSGDEFTLSMHMCTECYDANMEFLDALVLDKQSQLTIDLPSQGDRGGDNDGPSQAGCFQRS